MRPHFFAASAVLPSLLALTFGLTIAVPEAQARLEDSPKAVVDEAWQLVYQEYVDRNFNQVNWLQVREELLSRDYDTPDQAYRAIRQSLKRLGDPYTRFLDPEEFASLKNQTSGELSGLGIRLTRDADRQTVVILDVLPNSPASGAGLRKGDQLHKIDGKITSLMTLNAAAEALQGEEGTEVTLSIRRGASRKTFDVLLKRARVELPSVSYNLRQEQQLKVGYIKLDEFSSHATDQMKKAIETLTQQDAQAFVLDLRGNPGGLLFASVDIARLWMQEGKIVRTVDRRGGDRQFQANHTALTSLPLVVLVDGNSASASEILAGALKDNQRATLVGTRTYGKGLVQSVHDLADGSGLAVTISRYYPPSGININHHGIMPNVTVELDYPQQQRLDNNPGLWATEADPQYAEAVSLLRRNGVPTLNQSVHNASGIKSR
jgi:carboxyl-terminal processing protease